MTDYGGPPKGGQGVRTLLAADYSALGIAFTALFQFERTTDTLTAVQLEPINEPDCKALLPKLVAI